jgi:hypothetical protein
MVKKPFVEFIYILIPVALLLGFYLLEGSHLPKSAENLKDMIWNIEVFVLVAVAGGIALEKIERHVQPRLLREEVQLVKL